jgi:RNA polymerase sigma factor (sigma-70 family)
MNLAAYAARLAEIVRDPKLPSPSPGIPFTPANGYAYVSSDDATLVRRCLRDDSAAIQSLVERFQGDVLGLCLRLLHHRHDAEDVCQEVFIRVFRSLRRWDQARPLKPWIMSIAFNRCKTWLGLRSRRPELVDYLHETAAGPANEEPNELASEIQIALKALRVEYRTVFVLFHEQGLAYDDIAAAVGKPVGTVKTWLHRARHELLEYLKRRGMVPEVDHEMS